MTTIFVHFSDHLVTRDLKKIRYICWEARNKWIDIGLELNLEKDDLEALQDRYKDNDDCFREMLDLWLKKNLSPKLADLTAALKQPAVGFLQLAEELEREGFKRDKTKHHSVKNQLQIAPTMQMPVSICQICDTKLTCPQCTKENMAKLESRTRECNSIIIQFCIPVFLAVVFLVTLHLSNAYISPKDCLAIGSGLEMAEIGERAYAVLHIVNQKGYPYIFTTKDEIVECEVTHESTRNKLDCGAVKTRGNQYEISYQPTSRGRHQLHIKVEGEHIKGSPFPVTVRLPLKKLGIPVKTIIGMKKPWGMAFNHRGEILVVERYGHCISIFSPTGENLESFGSEGSGPGQFNGPRGIAVDDDDNILVTDGDNHVQKYSSKHKHLTNVGSKGSNSLEFHMPVSVAVSPTTKKIVVMDCLNHRAQILNPNLTYNSSIGSKGSGNGQLNKPYNAAFDSAGNVYITDALNNRIQVFTPEGNYLRQFGKSGKGNGEINYPIGIYIDSDDTVYVVDHGNHRVSVFTREGKFLTSFGSYGRGPGQFNSPRGIIMDKNGTIIVSDSDNNRLQMF